MRGRGSGWPPATGAVPRRSMPPAWRWRRPPTSSAKTPPTWSQEWTRGSLDKSGIDGFREAATQAKIALPDRTNVSEAVAGVLFAFVEGKVGSGAFEAAVGSVEAASPVLSDEVAQKLYEFAFDTWAKQALDREDWRGALAIYDEGLARAPKSSLLKHNREYTQSKL